jgi:hypothetical protein
MWFSADTFVLLLAQAACIAAPAAGVPRWAERFTSRGWALVAPVSIALVIGAIAVIPSTAQLLTWVALILVPLGAALAFGWAAHGARPPLALLAIPLLALAWAVQDERVGQSAAAILIAASAITAGRLLAGVAPLRLLEAGVVVMAIVDSVLVFSGQLQGPNSVLVAASPGAGLPQLQSAAFGSAGLGYGDLFAAAVVGGIFAVRGEPRLAAGAALVAVALVWDQLFLVREILPATVPPALVLLAFGAYRYAVSKGCERLPAQSGLAR